MVHGKGWYIWQTPRCEGGDPEAIALRAAQAGCTHLILKVAERTHAFGFDRFNRDLLPPVVQAAQARGLAVWGWHRVVGDQPEAEARVAAQRARQLALAGYVINAEAEYAHPSKAAAARLFMAALRRAWSGRPLALASFPHPTRHPQFPWAPFVDACDVVMPQTYWPHAHNPGQQLERAVTEYHSPQLVGAVRPLIPTGSAFTAGAWRPTPEEITAFFHRARALGLPGANLYAWDEAGLPAHRDLWDAAAAFAWPPPEPPADITTRWLAAVNARDLPGVLALYTPQAGHLSATHTRVGQAALRDWYLGLFNAWAPTSRLTAEDVLISGDFRRVRWSLGPAAQVFEDLFGLRDGRIEYHSTSLR